MTYAQETIKPYKEDGGSKREQVGRMFDNIAHSYDRLNHTLSLGVDKWWRQCAMDYLKAYLEAVEAAPYCEPIPKKEKSSIYVEGLLANGGPSTDIFKKGIGEEKTGELFRNILFGTAR